jgi:glucose/arabinose dehydrogenase
MSFYQTAVILSATILILSQNIVAAFAYDEVSYTTKLFGCQQYGDSIHCNPLLNELAAYETTGNSTLVHPLTSSDTLFVDGISGQALEMRGEYRESIEIPNSPQLNPNNFSVSFWIKSTNLEPYGHVVSHSNKAQTSGWQFDVSSSPTPTGSTVGTLRFGVFNTNKTLFSPGGISVPADNFTHIIGTFDGSTVRLYKDGLFAGEREFLGNYTADPGVPLRIGSAAYCSSCNRWSGIIDDVRMYNRSLDAQEIRQLFDKSSNVSSDLIGYWKFDGSTKDFLNQHDGTTVTMLTSMVFSPEGQLFFNEKNNGAIRIMDKDRQILAQPFANVDDLYANWEQGMLGLAIDPEFDSNHYVYLYYTALVGTEDGSGGKVINRVLRFTDVNNTGTDKTIILDNIPASRGYHSGGAMAFGPDGKLYITVGDATEHIFAQDPSIVIGKVLRINKDGTIPADNPYPNFPVYTIGHRNMYGIAFDDNGTGLVTENGDFHFDEINLITKGGNYGFPTLQPPNLPPELANNSSIKPLRSYWDTIAPTQMIYYNGSALPKLKGMFLFGSFTGDIYAIKLSEDRSKITQEIKINLEHYPFVPTVGIAQSLDGKIFYGGYQIYTLDSIGEFKPNLSTIRFDVPPGVDIGEVNFEKEHERIVINASSKVPVTPNATLTVRIPTDLIDNVTSAALLDAQQNQSAIESRIDYSEGTYASVTINLGPLLANDSSVQVAIQGVS